MSDDTLNMNGDTMCAAAPEAAFVVDVEGYEGPIDVLLSLAREQKVDLIHVSIVELAEQYLKFVTEACAHNLELAADYLVMAAWLAYLKSKLLLPELNSAEEPSGEELAAALHFQMQRLEAMQKAGAALMARGRLGRDFYSRGAPERFQTNRHTVFDANLADLLQAYAQQKGRTLRGKTLHIERSWELQSIEDALSRLRAGVRHVPDWRTLSAFLPRHIASPLTRRSALASTFGAALQLAKEGRITLRQDGVYGPLYFQTTEAWEKPFVSDEKLNEDGDSDT